jgi:hypothetical protein
MKTVLTRGEAPKPSTDSEVCLQCLEETWGKGYRKTATYKITQQVLKAPGEWVEVPVELVCNGITVDTMLSGAEARYDMKDEGGKKYIMFHHFQTSLIHE